MSVLVHDTSDVAATNGLAHQTENSTNSNHVMPGNKVDDENSNLPALPDPLPTTKDD